MWKRAAAAALLSFVVVAGGTLAYLYLRKPAMAPPSTEKVAPTPVRLARGEALFHRIAHCADCHSGRDETRFGRPAAGPAGAGAEMPLTAAPGRLIARNLTPDPDTGLGRWTDGEIIRAIREGISRDGRALFPVMPYTEFRSMSDEDARSLVVYLRSLEPVRSALPETQIRFPANLFIKSVPQPAGEVPAERGAYLARIAGCAYCHTDPETGQTFAGGRVFATKYATVVSANVSPDAETGIGKWSEEQFLEKFYQYKPYAENGPPKIDSSGYTVMPWLSFSRWPPEDLAAVYSYLLKQKGFHHAVETHPGT